MTSFADITTIAVGGGISRFIEPTSRVGVIEAVEDADREGLPLCVVGGGSNLLVDDDPFPGVVLRDARRVITVPDEAAPVEHDGRWVHINAEAGCNWDDLVAFSIELGLSGIEGLSGIPGTVGASVVQNIGSYGQEVASSVESVEAWDRASRRSVNLASRDLRFGYRSSALKSSMYEAPGIRADRYFPTPRYVVLSVTLKLRHSAVSKVGHGQLAKALGVGVGGALETGRIRDAVLSVRASKGMLEDAHRYEAPAMAACRRDGNIEEALRRQRKETGHDRPDPDRHSCGSFFMNPILTPEQAEGLPGDAPRFEAAKPDGMPVVKTSAAWLIDHAGFHKGFRLSPNSRAGLSSLHTLALTNRAEAKALDIAELACAVRKGVRSTFGVTLVPEPVVVGVAIG